MILSIVIMTCLSVTESYLRWFYLLYLWLVCWLLYHIFVDFNYCTYDWFVGCCIKSSLILTIIFMTGLLVVVSNLPWF